MLLGGWLSAAQSLEWGLVNRVAPGGQARGGGGRDGRASLAKSPSANRTVKALVDRAGDIDLGNGLALELDLVGDHMRSADAAEGLAAFAEKRTPLFRTAAGALRATAMDFAFAPEQEELASRTCARSRRRSLPPLRPLGRHRRVPVGGLAGMGELGLLGMRIPEAYGGQETDLLTMGIGMEEIGRGDFSCTYAIQLAGLAGEIIGKNGGRSSRRAGCPGPLVARRWSRWRSPSPARAPTPPTSTAAPSATATPT